jgi:N-acetylmuramoyl-L-alanine amidase
MTNEAFPYDKVTSARFNATDAGHMVVTIFAKETPMTNVYVKYLDEFQNVFSIFGKVDHKIELSIADSCTEIIPVVPTWPEFWIPADEEPPRKIWRVLLSPGHSASAQGAHGRGPANTRPEEYAHNVLQAKIIKQVLEATGRFKADIFDIDPDDLIAVGQRAAGYHLFIDIHHNAANADGNDEGSEVFYPTGNAMSLDLATDMSYRIAKAIGAKNRGAKPANFTTIATAIKLCPCAVLTEAYFIDDYSDQNITQSRSVKAAISIAESVINRWK